MSCHSNPSAHTPSSPALPQKEILIHPDFIGLKGVSYSTSQPSTVYTPNNAILSSIENQDKYSSTGTKHPIDSLGESPASSKKRKFLGGSDVEYITEHKEIFEILRLEKAPKASTASTDLSISPNNLQNSEPDLNKASMNTPLYIFENGLRKVLPYWFTYNANAKQRWFGRSIIDVFSVEFRGKDAGYYASAIEKGTIKVNNSNVPLDYKIRNGDLITHYIHRHEPPVFAHKVKILGLAKVDDTQNLLGIEKPAGIPVHPIGRYNYNSVLEILKHENGFRDVHPANRLDRLVSGVMVMPTSRLAAQILAEQMSSNKIKKTYICRVLGDFPYKPPVVCEAPIRTIAHKLGLNYVDFEHGKPCSTEFIKLHSDGNTSVLLCKPLTGRTHQIRVHLQYLGYPIANDPIYCNPNVWGINLGVRGKLPELSAHQPAKELKFSTSGFSLDSEISSAGSSDKIKTSQILNNTSQLNLSGSQFSPFQAAINNLQKQIQHDWLTKFSCYFLDIDHEKMDQAFKTDTLLGSKQESDGSKKSCISDSDSIDTGLEICNVCGTEEPKGLSEGYDIGIWLHALSYSGPTWHFETEIPNWARENYFPKIPDFILESKVYIQNAENY